MHDLNSLFAGKLHALLHRPYPKGRDFYDFVWYMGHPAMEVNGLLLANAIKQTEGKTIQMTDETLKKILIEKFEKTDFTKLKKDVAPFVSDTNSLTLFDKNIFIQQAQMIQVG